MRKIIMKEWNPTPEVIEKIKEEKQKLTDLYKREMEMNFLRINGKFPNRKEKKAITLRATRKAVKHLKRLGRIPDISPEKSVDNIRRK